MKLLLDKYFEKTSGFFPFFKYCPKKYWTYYFNKRASQILGYDYNPEEPRTLNEKIRWLIFNEKLELKTKLTDKILVKGYVASKIGPNHTAELYGHYNNFNQIDFSMIPNRFALKANHGWKMNAIIKNKDFIYKNYKDFQKITNRWLKTNYEEYSTEPQYRNIEKKLLIEQLRESEFYRVDIQVLCFNGKPLFVELNQITDLKNSEFVEGQLYDTKWNLQDYTTSGQEPGTPVPAPPNLDKILEFAELLSKDFSFVRIDFAYDNENIHVVEMTFTPFSAIIPFKSRDIDLKLGEMLILPKKEDTNEKA